MDRTEHGSMLLLGLLKPRVSASVARADLDAIMGRLALAAPGPEASHRSDTIWLSNIGTNGVRQPLFLLMATVTLVLLIACANVASLLLVRSLARSPEMAVRAAVGAGRLRLGRQLITENLAIAVFGGALGLLLAILETRALVHAAPPDIPRLGDIRLHLPVLLFAVLVSTGAGLLAAIAPIVDLRRLDLVTALKGGAAPLGTSRHGESLRSALIIAEIAITFVLTFGSGLLLRSLYLAETSSPGFDARGVLALELRLPESRYRSSDAIRGFYVHLIDDLRGEPGVEAVGAVNCPPSTSGCAKGWYSIADQPSPPPGDVPLTLLTSVDPGYFSSLRIPLLAGRSFSRSDDSAAPGVAIINDLIARRWWPGSPQSAIGHRIKLGGPYMEGPAYEIVGVTTALSQAGLGTSPFAEIYLPFAQSTSPDMVVMIRTTGDPARFEPEVRREVTSLDHELPIASLQPFDQWMQTTLGQRRFSTMLFFLFTALAVLLAASGIYGVLNYWVHARRAEIAIRLALGADQVSMLRWAGQHLFRVVAIGIAFGTFGTFVAARWLKSLVTFQRNDAGKRIGHSGADCNPGGWSSNVALRLNRTRGRAPRRLTTSREPVAANVLSLMPYSDEEGLSAGSA